MIHPPPLTSGLIALRAGLGLLLLVLAGAAGLTGASPAQDTDPKGAKAGKQEPDKQPPAKDKKRDEEEEENPKKRKIIRVEEDAKPPTPARPEAAPVIDLAQAARQAKHPAVKELFQTLAVPHDVVTFKAFSRIESQNREKRINVEPIPPFVGNNPTGLKNKIDLRPFDDDWRLQKAEPHSPGTIKSIQPYEQVAHDAVKQFLANGFERLQPGDKRYLSAYDQQVYAGQALTAALRFHESARSRGARKGEEWDGVKDQLSQYLLLVSLEQLQELAKAKDWEAAFELGRQLSEKYPDAADQKQIAQPLSKLLTEALDSRSFTGDKLREVRERWRQLARQFPGTPAVEQLNTSLRKQAEALFDLAKQLDADKKEPARVQELLKQAEETWPELPGLRAYRLKRAIEYPILRVGVRELPEYLSPSLAYTGAEVRAVELLFEGLMKASPDAAGAVSYRPGLAEGRARVTALGREFQLPADAFWSNGKQVTVADIRYTLRQWRQGHGTGRSVAWGDLFAERDEVTSRGDPPRVTVHLRQGCPDPLALMTFKIVPQPSLLPGDLRQADGNVAEKAFARRPIGSGPYHLDSSRFSDEHGRSCLIFLANFRPGGLVQPSIQEIRFYKTNDPVKELKDETLDLVLDLSPEQAKGVKESLANVVLSRPASSNRRVYFLAVNHRNQALQNPAVRRALALAINREQLLDEHFRKGLGAAYHKALDGPYPARSWALNPVLKKRETESLDLFDRDLALGLLQEAKGISRPVTLSLKYPDDDNVLDNAMKALAEQVEKNTGGAIQLQLQTLKPHELREAVEGTHSYDLAYYHYDYPDETFWLGPLLGPRALPQGGNYLGYQGDVSLRVQNALAYRDFSELQKEARKTHEKLLTEMPLIPLWQLDPLIALQAHVKPVSFDPWLVFTDIEQWRLDRR
jgi:ABC-type oligopeptide transport system substrate-binding subunit